jgi:hypothetical protein
MRWITSFLHPLKLLRTLFNTIGLGVFLFSLLLIADAQHNKQFKSEDQVVNETISGVGMTIVGLVLLAL